MPFVMNCKIETHDYEISLFDINKLIDSEIAQNYQILRLNSFDDGSLDTDSLFISTFVVSGISVNLRVNLLSPINEKDGRYYLPELKLNIRCYEFYDVHEVLYLMQDIMLELFPKGVVFEVSTNIEYKISNE